MKSNINYNSYSFFLVLSSFNKVSEYLLRIFIMLKHIFWMPLNS